MMRKHEGETRYYYSEGETRNPGWAMREPSNTSYSAIRHGQRGSEMRF